MTCSIESAIIAEAAPKKYARKTGCLSAANERGGALLTRVSECTRLLGRLLFPFRAQRETLLADFFERLLRMRDRLVANLYEELDVADLVAAIGADHHRLRTRGANV